MVDCLLTFCLCVLKANLELGVSASPQLSKKPSASTPQKKTADKDTGLLLKDVNKARAIASTGDSPPASPSSKQQQPSPPLLPHQVQQPQISGKVPYTHSSAPEQLSKTPATAEANNNGNKTQNGSAYKKVAVSALKSNHVISEPNTKKLVVESSVKRKIHTSSTAAANSSAIVTAPSALTNLFLVTPKSLKFGSVVIGSTYRLNLSVANSGIDTGRYTVKHNNANNVSIHYTPGPVAPGISVKLEVELRANQLGLIQDEIRIETDTEIFRLPVSATVVDVHEVASPSKSARLVFTKTSLVKQQQQPPAQAAESSEKENE